MPYGFIRYIEDKGYSTETIDSYAKVVNQFFSFIKKFYPDNKDPFEILPSDIHRYLKEQQLGKGKSISTINKELAIIKTLFNYLWEKDIVPIDPTVKIKRFKTDSKPTVNILYPDLVKILDQVLVNPDYTPSKKAFFLLAMKGLKLSEFRFKMDDVTYSDREDYVEIQLKNRLIVLKDLEAICFLEHYRDSIFNGSDFVFVSKLKGSDELVPLRITTVFNHLKVIAMDYLPSNSEHITLSGIRRSIAFYLYSDKKYSIQRIAKELGIEENSASNYLKNIEHI